MALNNVLLLTNLERNRRWIVEHTVMLKKAFRLARKNGEKIVKHNELEKNCLNEKDGNIQSCRVTTLKMPVESSETPRDDLKKYQEKADILLKLMGDDYQLSLTDDGCGGVYMVKNKISGGTVAVFKPRDEEYMAPENPRGFVKENSIVGVTEHPIQTGFKIGNGAIKEVAAYVLDAANGHFSNVPKTTLKTLNLNGKVKEGSLQEFVNSESSCEDMGSSFHSIEEVSKIGVLDVRLCNTDRHGGNILLQENNQCSSYRMVPIDHGFTLPSFLHLENVNFEWLYWSQAKFPFQPETLDFILNLNDEKDACLLRELGIDENEIFTMRICTRLLKKGASLGFTLYDIGNLLQRQGDGSEKSKIEDLIEKVLIESKLKSKTKFNSQEYSLLLNKLDDEYNALFSTLVTKKARSISSIN